MNESVENLYVTDDRGQLQGTITLNDVKAVINEAGLEHILIAADLMNRRCRSVTPQNSLLECIDGFAAGGEDQLPVVKDRTTPELLGVVTHRSVFQLYNHEVLKKGTFGLKYVHGSSADPRRDYAELAEDHCLRVVPVTEALSGRTLRDLDLRKRYHVNVVSIRRSGYEHGQRDSEVPDPGQELQPTDSLVVVGPRNSIKEFEQEVMGVRHSDARTDLR